MCEKPTERLTEKGDMCYNRMYALENPKIGQIVVSRMGHDRSRAYVIAAVLGKDFVLVTDGKARSIDKPKTKRIKHLTYIGYSQEAAETIEDGKITDAAVRKILKEFAPTDKTEI